MAGLVAAAGTLAVDDAERASLTTGQPARDLTTGQPLSVSTTWNSVNEPLKGRAGALALIGAGGALLIVGIGCGAGALVTQNTINDGGSYFPNDYRALVNRATH